MSQNVDFKHRNNFKHNFTHNMKDNNILYYVPYETYLYGTKFGDFWKKSPYFRTTKIVTAISISHTLIFM